MKDSSRYTTRALAALAAAAVIGLAGACKDKGTTGPPPPPPPPPPPVAPAAPTNLTATATSPTQINLAWTDASTNEDGFKIESCSGADCTNFAAIGQVAANVVGFSNTGLAASTGYSYRVLAFNTVGNSEASTTTGTTLAPPVAPGAVMVGAGEITSCASTASGLTAGLVDAVVAENPNAIIYTVGNNLTDATPGASWDCFDNSWGRFKASANFRVALGQRDYEVGQPAGGTDAVYAYFGDKAGAPNGWYSFDVGTTWHVIVLNTSTWQHGQANLTEFTSAQNTWLADDLAANTRPCTMAIFNLRRYYSYGSFENMNAKTIWNILHVGGADVVVSAVDKYYERWAPQNHDMARDDATGIRQFIVGTGGRTLDNFASAWRPVNEVPNLEVRDASTWGVLKFTLDAASYTWDFIPTTPGGFTDTGTANCH